MVEEGPDSLGRDAVPHDMFCLSCCALLVQVDVHTLQLGCVHRHWVARQGSHQ